VPPFGDASPGSLLSSVPVFARGPEACVTITDLRRDGACPRREVGCLKLLTSALLVLWKPLSGLSGSDESHVLMKI
jgi:hypothetical protein